ncbi:hypothetical protein [Streptomyces echinatus]|uniref:hypothetical protein n=1 Tax=Streptomyces echinatus TaxID=67293 RepID=UPI0031EBC74C
MDDVPELREAAMASREALGGSLADQDWMTRFLDETHARMDELARIQRPLPRRRPSTARRPPRAGIHVAPAHPRCGGSAPTPRRWNS